MRGIKASSSSSSSEEGNSPTFNISRKDRQGSTSQPSRGRAVLRRTENGKTILISKGRAKPEVRQTRKPGKQEQSKPRDEEEECKLMEISELRDVSNVSEANLSNILEVEEHEEIELAKTEAELHRMGSYAGCGLSNICKDLEQMLEGPGSTSTPKLSTTSTTSAGSSMPPLVSATSSDCNSGMQGSSDYLTGSPPPLVFSPPRQALASPTYSPYTSPAYSPITPKDAAIQNFETGNHVFFSCLNKSFHRQTRDKVS